MCGPERLFSGSGLGNVDKRSHRLPARPLICASRAPYPAAKDTDCCSSRNFDDLNWPGPDLCLLPTAEEFDMKTQVASEMPDFRGMPNAPKVTVISAYHEREHAVEETLRSIASQTFEDFQAIIWDDASRDGTATELVRVATQISDDRFHIVCYKQNIGLTAGLNAAIAATDSPYIAVVGSGDSCHPRRLSEQVKALERNPDAVFCASASTTKDPVTGDVFLDSEFSRARIELSDITRTCPFTHGSVMYRTSALRQVGEFAREFKWCADWDMFFRLLRSGDAIYLRDTLYFRTAQPDGVSFHPQKAFDQIKFKHLALELNCPGAERSKLLAVSAQEGVMAALDHRRGEISRDLARRNIKLYFMRRRDDASRMIRIAQIEDIRYSFKYRVFLRLAQLLSATPLSQSLLIRVARALPR